MKNATAKNDVQVIQKALEEYLGNRKAAEVAAEISAAMQDETRHTHLGEDFYIHKDKCGNLVPTTESVVKNKVEAILNLHLEKDEVQECIKLLIREQHLCETKATAETAKFQTIKVEGSYSEIYAKLLKYKTAARKEDDFKACLMQAVSASVQDFKVVVCDSLFDPKEEYSYNDVKDLAEKNGLRLGNKFEYVLFLGTLINNLIAEGWSEEDAWHSVCVDSRNLKQYCNSADAKHDFKLTGFGKIADKCGLTKAFRILDKKDEKEEFFWIAGGIYNYWFGFNPLTDFGICSDYDYRFRNRVGWFVL